MMTETFIRRCHEFAQLSEDTECDADSLIGFFQLFRPDGRDIEGLFDDLPCGADLHQRLDELYEVAGEDRRPSGGRDAYFLVRNPPAIDPERARQLADKWLTGIRDLARELCDGQVASLLDQIPSIRVLEGHAPKNPKLEHEKSDLLKAMQSRVPALTSQITNVDARASVLMQAYYFITCDPMIRDHLMWPLFSVSVSTIDPFAAYFELWKHNVKYRIFGNQQIDIYLPRH